MTWQKGDGIVQRQLRSHGLSGTLAAGRICQHAESLYPGLFTAPSCRDGVLKLKVESKNLVAVRLIEGKLLREMQEFAITAHLPSPTSIQLTVSRFSDTV